MGRILLLGHGDTYDFNEESYFVGKNKVTPIVCKTAGVPLNLATLWRCDTLDILASVKPTIIQDFTKTMTSKHYDGMYSIITTMCVGWGLFVRSNGTLRKTAWSNTARLLQAEGYLIIVTPPTHIQTPSPFRKLSKDAKNQLLMKWNARKTLREEWDNLSIYVKVHMD